MVVGYATYQPPLSNSKLTKDGNIILFYFFFGSFFPFFSRFWSLRGPILRSVFLFQYLNQCSFHKNIVMCFLDNTRSNFNLSRVFLYFKPEYLDLFSIPLHKKAFFYKTVFYMIHKPIQGIIQTKIEVDLQTLFCVILLMQNGRLFIAFMQQLVL